VLLLPVCFYRPDELEKYGLVKVQPLAGCGPFSQKPSSADEVGLLVYILILYSHVAQQPDKAIPLIRRDGLHVGPLRPL
jgi:hypothetical protein